MTTSKPPSTIGPSAQDPPRAERHGTGIEWTHIPGYKGETWNPVTGCTKVSNGCAHCYAEGIANRFWGDRDFTDVQFHDDRLAIPLHWRKPRAIFVNSMSDLFHEDVPFEFIDKVLAVAALCPQHIFIVLTKRPERMAEYFEDLHIKITLRLHDAVIDMGMDDDIACGVANWINGWSRWDNVPDDNNPLDGTVKRWPLPNLWLGPSIENQKTAELRIPISLSTPAAVHIVSYEPALGPVDLSPFLKSAPDRVGWVIVGGESGPGARPSHPDWFRKVRDDCQAAGVPFFYKQTGAWSNTGPLNSKQSVVCGCGWSGPNIKSDIERYVYGGDGCPIHRRQIMYRVGKKAAGDFLDGRQHHAFPEVG